MTARGNALAARFAALLALGALTNLEPSPAAAQVPAKISQACGGDYRKLCADVTPGGGRIIACMQARKSEVSEGCRQALRDEQKRRGDKPS